MRLTDKLSFLTAMAGIACLCLLSSCLDEPESLYGDPVPVVFLPSITGEAGLEVSSRVLNNVWSGTEIVNIHMVASGGSLAADAIFELYRPTSSGTSVALDPINAAFSLYYPVDGSDMNFFAFSPYRPSGSNLVTYSLTDQSVPEKLEAVDFIWTKATGTYNKDNPNVELAFDHKQSKIIVTVTAGPGVFSTDMDTGSATLIMGNMPYGGVYDLSDGTLSSIVGTGSIIPFKSAFASTNVTWEAIVPPHSGTDYTSRKFNFTFNGKSYTYDLPTVDTYSAGYSYTYNLTLTTSGVVLKSTTVSNWTGGTTSWNGGKYVLHTTSSALNFSPAASSQTLTIQYQGTSTAPVAAVSTSATKITGTVDWLTASVADEVTTKTPWTERELTVSAITENPETVPRTGYVHVSLEGLSVVITVVQSGIYEAVDDLSNCYIVAPGNSITLPVARAVTLGGAPETAGFTVDKLWDDTSGGAVASYSVSGTGSSALITVTAGSNPGNAVIVAQVDGVTYWSWHIWVTDYNPWQGTTYTNIYNTNNNGSHFVFMDRNLGAIFAGQGNLADYNPTTNPEVAKGTGLFYQWGRKDPFPATKAAGESQDGNGMFTCMSVAEDVVVTVGSLTYSICYPGTFIYSTASPYDWYFDGYNNELWGHSGSKSVYDPCPTGWRIPKNFTATSSWTGFDSTNGTWDVGMTWGTNAVYPATGYRECRDSSLSKVKSDGYVWSASPYNSSSIYASNLRFSRNIAYANGSNNRANGIPVRCIRE